MKLVLALAFSAVAVSAAAQGHDSHGAPAAHAKAAPANAAAAGVVEGVGVIRAIDAKKGMVTIDHQPIKALNWGSMTMGFKVANPALLKGMAPGAKVAFQLKGQNTIVGLKAR